MGEMLHRVLIIQKLRENQELSCAWGDDHPQGTPGVQAGLQSAEIDSEAQVGLGETPALGKGAEAWKVPQQEAMVTGA